MLVELFKILGGGECQIFDGVHIMQEKWIGEMLYNKPYNIQTNQITLLHWPLSVGNLCRYCDLLYEY